MDRVTTGLLSNWQKSQDASSSLSESEQFERFVAYVVLSRMTDQQFSVDDYIVGGDGTLGVDGFALTINSELIPTTQELEDVLNSSPKRIEAGITLIQTKRSAHFDLGDLSVFSDTALNPLTSDEPPHEGLRVASEMLKLLYEHSSKFSTNPVLKMYYVTTGSWNQPAPIVSKIDDTVQRFEETNLVSRADFTPWGAKEIQTNWRAIDTAAETTVQFDQRTTLPDMAGIREAYLGVLPGVELVKLVSDEEGGIRKTLFFDNVRDFQGDNEVNKDIETTLSVPSEANHFCVLNNGVTVVTRELAVTGNRFRLRDFQIVNGCQTSHLLHRHKDSLDGVFVPFRLIVSESDDVTNSITRATNRQSQVTPENLLALADVQRRIEAYFNSFAQEDPHRIHYERRSRQWSGSSEVKGTWRVITLRNLMQSFASMFLVNPHTAARYYGDLRSRAGADVFNEAHHPAYYYTSAFAFCKLNHLFLNQQLDRKWKPARYFLLAGVRALVQGSIAAPKIEQTERKAEPACKPLNDCLWDDAKYLELIGKCISVLEEDLTSPDQIREVGRSRDFTDQFLKKLIRITTTA